MLRTRAYGTVAPDFGAAGDHGIGENDDVAFRYLLDLHGTDGWTDVFVEQQRVVIDCGSHLARSRVALEHSGGMPGRHGRFGEAGGDSPGDHVVRYEVETRPVQ